MGTREWSSCSGLPGYRQLENPAHREEIAKFWNIDPAFFPKARGLFQTDIFPAIETGQIKALWVIGTNPMTSMPNTPRIRKTLENLEFCVVQDAYEDVETADYAHVYLPASVWAEKEGCFTNTERRRQPDPRRDRPVRRLQARSLDLHVLGKAVRSRPRDELAGDAGGHVRGDETALQGTRPESRHLRQ